MILDETERFSDMIEAFECDFLLAMDKTSKFSLKDLQETIEEDCNSKLKKDLFEYLIQNRIFIDSLTDEELKRYKKTILTYYRARLKSKIRRFFKLEK